MVLGGAAITIVFYHFWGNRAGIFTHGYLAVDFFFIVSGFFLMRTCIYKKYKTGFDYVKNLFYNYFPKTTFVLIYLAIFNWIMGNWSINQLPHLLYEILYMYILGIASQNYVYSLLWYIPILCFILSMYFNLYIINASILKNVVMPIIIISSYSYIFAKYGSMADFRAIAAGDFFIKGIYRGAADIAVGSLLYIIIPKIENLMKQLRTSIILIVETITLFTAIKIMFCEIEVASDILIVPCSCILLILCYSERGILYRLMENIVMKFLGKHSLFIYLCQGYAINLTVRICRRILKITDLSVFNIIVSVVLIICLVLIALLFEYILIPLSIKLTRKIFIKNNIKG